SDDVNIQYHSDALQDRIEHMENLLDEGLSIALPLGVEIDVTPLWRMDMGKLAEVESKLVGAKIKTPDEARARFDMEPTAGGNTLWGQAQDIPLGLLADDRRWESANPMSPPPVTPIGSEADDTPTEEDTPD